MVIMEKIAQEFVEYVKVKHKEKQVLVLSAYLAQTVCDIFQEGNAFLCSLSPNLTEAIQRIDTGYRQSMRSCIGDLLDDQLRVDRNVDQWETGKTAGDRRVLISNFVDRTNHITLKRDAMRVGCLMTADGLDNDKIRQQALTKSHHRHKMFIFTGSEQQFLRFNIG